MPRPRKIVTPEEGMVPTEMPLRRTRRPSVAIEPAESLSPVVAALTAALAALTTEVAGLRSDLENGGKTKPYNPQTFRERIYGS